MRSYLVATEKPTGVNSVTSRDSPKPWRKADLTGLLGGKWQLLLEESCTRLTLLLGPNKHDFWKAGKVWTKRPIWSTVIINHNLKSRGRYRGPCWQQSVATRHGRRFWLLYFKSTRVVSILWQNVCHFQRLKIALLTVFFHSSHTV